ncbi:MULTISPECIES: Cdc6/Cdc18 family protein [Halorussus]|uniref:Cdc6/Cdc18 family protein n=1 Tax=Halorussus TaxID=1070314 RepID=UPI00209F80DA|nr:orc1/cdc6 family replication initiation protein [Halorussus vallis]USZ78735.1 orc1/cdc6 family replication initiation protein [Halorussus vallis]
MPTPTDGYSFTPQKFPYKNREALLDDYTPDTLVGRDDELQEYHAALLPAINGEQPDNIFLYGKAGVGKTASTRFLLDRLEQDADEYAVDIHSEMVNCDGLNSSYRVTVELVNNYRDPENQISETGYARSQVYDMLWQELDNRGGLHIIVLDEVDHMNDDSMLYQLSRARENEKIENARVAVIGISNDLTFKDSLSPKVRSSLCERAISFSTYDANELRAVLDQRQQVAFQEDVLSEDVVPLCAAYGAQESGDARKALDLLMKAGDKAREDAGSTEIVTETHVREGREMLEREEIQKGIIDLNEQERLILYALATFAAEGETPVQSRMHYKRYKQLTERAGSDSLSERWMREQTDELDMLGLAYVEEKNEGRRGGLYREHELRQDLEIVLDALSETIESVGIHESVQQYTSTNEALSD